MDDAAGYVGMPSEWLGETALVIKDAIAIRDLPADFVAELQDALDAIRSGFRNVGGHPNF